MTNSVIELFAMPSTKWDALADAVTMLQEEGVTLAMPTLEGDVLQRFSALSIAADGIAQRLDRGTMNAALVVVLCRTIVETHEQAPSRAEMVEALSKVGAFVARNTPEGKDAVPQHTFNRAIAMAALHEHGTSKQRKVWEGNQESLNLGGVGHWKNQKLDKAGLNAAIKSAETKSAGRTVAKAGNQGKADRGAAPADVAKENKALVDAAKNALRSATNATAKLAAFATDVRATVDNESLDAAQLRGMLRDMCDAITN